jgi:hypothetical protein
MGLGIGARAYGLDKTKSTQVQGHPRARQRSMQLEEARWVIIGLPPTLPSVYNQTLILSTPLPDGYPTYQTACFKLRAVLGQAQGMGHSQRHNVHMTDVAQTTSQAGCLSKCSDRVAAPGARRD